MNDIGVLFSINPTPCYDITSGKKTREIRKKVPKLSTPFKGYIYCTKPKGANDFALCLDHETGKVGYLHPSNYPIADRYNLEILSEKVIGEFVCDYIEEYEMEGYDKDADVFQAICRVEHEEDIGDTFYFYEVTNEVTEEEQLSAPILRESCLSFDEIGKYVCGKGDIGFHTFYSLHISELKIYDKPKDLSEFYIPCYSGCKDCGYRSVDSFFGEKELVCTVSNKKPIKRPPQSWCYVRCLESKGES